MTEVQDYNADCYVLAESRDLDFVNKFLETFVPNRKELQEVYEFPQFGTETELTFDTVEELIEFLISNPTKPYSIYWRSLKKTKSIWQCVFLLMMAI